MRYPPPTDPGRRHADDRETLLLLLQSAFGEQIRAASILTSAHGKLFSVIGVSSGVRTHWQWREAIAAVIDEKGILRQADQNSTYYLLP